MTKKRGDPKTSTWMLIAFFREYHEGLAQSGECIDNDCDVISKPYAKIISERLAQFQDDLQKYGNHTKGCMVNLRPINMSCCGWDDYGLKDHGRWGGSNPPPPSFDKHEIRQHR